MGKEIWQPMATNFDSDVSVRPSVRTASGGGGGAPRQTDGGRRMSSFLGGKSHGAFERPAFFLAGNSMTIGACEKEVSLKA